VGTCFGFCGSMLCFYGVCDDMLCRWLFLWRYVVPMMSVMVCDGVLYLFCVMVCVVLWWYLL
jgi:hypothetical protein